MTSSARVVLAVDPGRAKCGVAVASRNDGEPTINVLHKCVIDTDTLADTILTLIKQYSPEVVLVGDGTSSRAAVKVISSLDIAGVEVVDEKFTTLQARERYFKENPPRGLRKLLPISLQTPPVPYDDYVAVILAERFLTS